MKDLWPGMKGRNSWINANCVFCGVEGVNRSHVFSAGKYPELKNYYWNIYPMCPRCHTDGEKNFENLTTEGRLIRIAEHTSPREAKNVLNKAQDHWIKKRESFHRFYEYLAEL